MANGAHLNPTGEPPSRRLPVPLAERISREDTVRVIRAFYADLSADPEIGHFFAHIVDFAPHEKVIVEFWRTAMGERSSTPAQVDMLGKHSPLQLEPAHYARWLGCLETVLNRELAPDLAAQWLQMAHGIAETLQRRTQRNPLTK